MIWVFLTVVVVVVGFIVLALIGFANAPRQPIRSLGPYIEEQTTRLIENPNMNVNKDIHHREHSQWTEEFNFYDEQAERRKNWNHP